MSLSVSNVKESLEKLQHCLMGVSAWMTGSKLKLNPSKTEFLLIGFKLHHPQAQFSLYVHKGGLKPASFHFKLHREKNTNNSSCLILEQETNLHASAKTLVFYPTIA